MTSKPPEYLRLIRSISKQIESVPDGLKDFRNICREQRHVRAFDLKEKRADDVIQTLQRRMIIHPGHYEKFVKILEIINREDVIKMLPGYHDYKSKDAGNNNNIPYYNMKGIRETDEVTPSQSCTGKRKIEPVYTKRGKVKKNDVITLRVDEGGVADDELLNLSERIQPDLVIRLGIFLGIKYQTIKAKLSQGHERGTLDMLEYWREDVQEQNQRKELLQALEEAGLKDLVYTCFGEGEAYYHEDAGPMNRSSIVSEKILSKLASKMGEGWSQFGKQHLGMTKVNIDHFKNRESYMENQIFEMLYEWRRRNHADATIGKLLDLMGASQYISPDSFSFILEELHGTK